MMCLPHPGVITSLAEADRVARNEAVFAGVAIGAFLVIGVGGAILMLVALLT